jgi:hypothetical protein
MILTEIEFLRSARTNSFKTIPDLWAAINSMLNPKQKVHFASKSLTRDVFINISDNTTELFMSKEKYTFQRINFQNRLCPDISNSLYVCCELGGRIETDLIFCIETAISDLVYGRLSSIRDNVVEASYKSKDF